MIPTGAGPAEMFVVINPTSSPEPDEASSWRESALIGGAPGDPDSTLFVGNPTEDLDMDNLPALLEHAFGTSDSISNASPFQIISNGTAVQISTTLNQTADDIVVSLEKSTDMVTWVDASADLPELSRTNNGDGTVNVIFESASGYTGLEVQNFFRLKIELLP